MGDGPDLEAAGNIVVDEQLPLEMATRLKNEHIICSPYIIASLETSFYPKNMKPKLFNFFKVHILPLLALI